MFTGEKVAQMAAYFMDRGERPRIAILKLMKLLYLADRESVARYGEPISFDRMVSMDHGPLLSRTYNLVGGCVGGRDAEQWSSWISTRAGYDVVLIKSVSREELDHLSDADIEVLADVWDEFGHMDRWQISEYTHEHCKEWKNPNRSSLPISDFQLLVALGHNEEEANEMAQLIGEQRDLDRVISAV